MTDYDDNMPIHSAKALHDRTEAKKKAEKQEKLRKEGEAKGLAMLVAEAIESRPEVSKPELREFSTVTSVRETALSFDADLQNDMDHFIEQLKEQSDAYLRAVSSEPQITCSGLGIQMGKVPLVTAAKLAEGELVDRQRDSDKGHGWWKLAAAFVLGLVSSLTLMVIKP